MQFQPVKPTTVSAQIAEQIRAAILSGELSPNDKLPPERELSEVFGVSRPSLRKALNMLASAGLVASYQGGGTVVRSLMEKTKGNLLAELVKVERERVLDVVEVRKGLESFTAFYAAKRALPEDLRKMELVISDMANNLENGKTSEVLDACFHMLVAKASHNVVWLHTIQSLFDSMKIFQQTVCRAVYLTGEDKVLYAHHFRIFESIFERNAEAAREAMLEHLIFAEQRSSTYI